MVNNPLYPGYLPKKEDEENINPLYPGYYTGKPLPKRPGSKKYIKPIEYNFDEILEGIDDIGKAVSEAPLAGPKWVKDRIIDDWKNQLKVSVGSNIKVTDIDDYSTEEFPGATATLSLNPEDWGIVGKKRGSETAKKQIKKTLTSWVKESTGIDVNNLLKSDFSDIENKANEELWKYALRPPDPGDTAPKQQRRGGKVVAERTTAFFKDFRDKENPLNIKNVGAWKEDGGGNKVYIEDIYKDTAAAAMAFVNQRGNPKYRDANHSKFLKEAVTAANTEIQSAYKYSNTVSATAEKMLKNHSGAIDFFDARVQTVNDIHSFQKKIEDSAKVLKKIELGTSNSPSYSIWDDLDKTVKEAVKNKDARVKSVKDLLNKGAISQKSYDSFLKNIKSYDDYLNKISTNVEKAKSDKNSAAVALKFLDGNAVGSSLAKRNTFKESVVGGFQKELEFSLLSKDKDQIGSLLQDKDLISEGVDLRARVLAPVAYRLRQDRTRYATKELLNAWDDEKLLERYVWKEVQRNLPPRIAAFTSGKFVGDALEKRNYFGLKISEDTMDSIKNKNPDKFARLDKRYAYKVNIDLDPAMFDGVRKISVRGGKSFDVLKNDLFKSLNPDDITDKQLLAIGLKLGTDVNTGTPPYALYQNQVSKRFFAKRYADLSQAEKDKIDGLFKNLENYNMAMADKFKDKLTEDQKQKLLDTVKHKNNSLNEGYKLDRKHIGGLEKIHNRMLSIKSKLEASKLGKVIKFASNWKNIVSEKVVALVSKAVAKILGIASAATGFLAVIGPIIEQVAQKVIEKGINYTVAFLKGALKWDFKKFNEMVQKDMKKLLKTCLVASVIPILAIFIPIYLFFIVFSTVMSPLDTTRDDHSGDICTLEDIDCDNVPEIPMKDIKGLVNANNINCSAIENCSMGLETALISYAYDIVSGLTPGYWCMYNQPDKTDPQYAEYYTIDGRPIFDDNVFEILGEAACEETVKSTSDQYHVLFWCTMLLEKAYNLACVPDANTVLDLGADTTRYNVITAAGVSANNGTRDAGWDYQVNNGKATKDFLRVGDIIFFVKEGDDESDHVAMIGEIKNVGGVLTITTIESNAETRQRTLQLGSDGIWRTGGLEVQGFGGYTYPQC